MADKVLTEEVRQEMLGLLPFSPEVTIEFEPTIFAKFPEEARPTFILKPLEDAQKAGMFKLLKRAESANNEEFRAAVRPYVVGWKQLYDLGTMEVIPFEADEDGGALKKLFAPIPSKVIGEILSYLTRVSGLTDIERVALTS